MQYSNYSDAGFRTEFFALVEKSEHVVITAHVSPDDDSIASVLSVYTILTLRYPEKKIRIVYEGVPSERHQVFAHFDKIEFVPNTGAAIVGTDLLIILDVNRLARVSMNPETILAHGIANTIVIDHHATPPDAFTLTMIVPEVTSNSELIYRSLDARQYLNKDLAEHFLLGILGDTGNFAYVPPAQSEVFIIAKELIEMVDMPIDLFRSRYGGIPLHIVPLLQTLVQNMYYVDVPGWPKVQVTYVDRAVMETGNFTDEDMSAASHIYMGQYVPKVQGCGWGLVATPREDGSARISGRSLKGSVNVRDLFERMQIGGGHDRASGAYIKKIDAPVDGKEALERVLTWMKDNQPMLG